MLFVNELNLYHFGSEGVGFYSDEEFDIEEVDKTTTFSDYHR